MKKEYFTKAFCRLLPFFGGCTAVMVLLNLLLYGSMGKINAAAGVNADVLCGSAKYLMVFIGVFFAAVSFSYLWKKDALFNGRNTVFRSLGAMLAGALLLFAMLLVNALTMRAIVFVNYPTAACALPALFFSFFSMLGGYLAVFAAAFLAATLSNGLFACLLLTAVVLWLPTALAIIFQSPFFAFAGDVSTAQNGILSLNTIAPEGIFLFPSFYSISGNELSVSSILSFSMGLTNVGQIVYNYILWVCFFWAGAFICSRRKKPVNGNAYFCEIFADIVLFLLFFPLAFAALYFSGSRLLFCFAVAVLFFLAALLLRKGRQGIIRTVVCCAACFIFAGLLFVITSKVGGSLIAYKNYNVSQVEKIDVYAAPTDVACLEDIETDTVRVTIDNKDALKSILQAAPRTSNSDLSMPHKNQKITVYLDDGKVYTSYFMLQTSAAEALYGYIENYPKDMSALDAFSAFPVLSSMLCTDGAEAQAVDASYAEASTPSSATLYWRYTALYDTLEKYSYALAAKYSGYDYSQLEKLNASFEGRAVLSYRYINGKYYISAREISASA